MADEDVLLDLFVSYHEADRSILVLVAEQLRAAGRHVWLDLGRSSPGDSLDEPTAEALVRARRLACFFGTSRISDRQRAEVARFRAQSPGGASPSYFPVLLPGWDVARRDEIFALMGEISWLDLRGGYAHPHAIKLLLAAIDGRAPGRPDDTIGEAP